jgi:hypothetical protein
MDQQQEEKRKIIMVIEGSGRDRELIKLSRIDFDADEELNVVTFEIAPDIQTHICDALGSFVPASTDFGVMTIALDVPRIRGLVEHFADPRTPRTREADAIFNRMIVLLATFRKDLL